MHGYSLSGDQYYAAPFCPIIAGANRAMRTKKGRTLHLKGRVLPFSEDDHRAGSTHAGELLQAMRREATKQRGSVKRFMGWTGASERTVKAWLSGASLPSADHLIALMASSDEIFGVVVGMAGRRTATFAKDIAVAQSHLAQAAAIMERMAAATIAPEGEPLE